MAGGARQRRSDLVAPDRYSGGRDRLRSEPPDLFGRALPTAAATTEREPDGRGELPPGRLPRVLHDGDYVSDRHRRTSPEAADRFAHTVHGRARHSRMDTDFLLFFNEAG